MAFLRAFTRQLRAARQVAPHGAWAALHEERPEGVDRRTWEGLFEYAAWKAALLLAPEQVLPFAENLCNPERFTRRLWS